MYILYFLWTPSFDCEHYLSNMRYEFFSILEGDKIHKTTINHNHAKSHPQIPTALAQPILE